MSHWQRHSNTERRLHTPAEAQHETHMQKYKQWKCQNANANIYQRLRGGAVQTVGRV